MEQREKPIDSPREQAAYLVTGASVFAVLVVAFDNHWGILKIGASEGMTRLLNGLALGVVCGCWFMHRQKLESKDDALAMSDNASVMRTIARLSVASAAVALLIMLAPGDPSWTIGVFFVGQIAGLGLAWLVWPPIPTKPHP